MLLRRLSSGFSVWSTLLLAAGFMGPAFGPTVTAQTRVVWATDVRDYSSEYSDRQYAAAQALGAPDAMPGGGANPVAWSAYYPDQEEEYLDMEFGQSIEARQVVVAESFNPGGIRRIEVGKGFGPLVTVYEDKRPAPLSAGSRMFRVPVPEGTGRIDRVLITLCGDCVKGYQHIDAVGITASTGPVEAPIHLAEDFNPGPPENMGRRINSGQEEVHPIISPDGQRLYFTRKNHPENLGGQGLDDIWLARRGPDGDWARAEHAGRRWNSTGEDYLNAITGDGGMALLVVDSKPDDRGNPLSVSFRQEGGWSSPQALQVDDYATASKYASFHLSADGEVLLLSLAREEGEGGKDLYAAFREDATRYGAPMHLGETINTAAEEVTPFLAPDGKTLYFASNGLPGYGSADVFVSRRLDDNWERWTEPRNLGPSVNGSDWDAFFSVAADGAYGYFASYNDAIGGSDIFRLPLDGEARPDSTILLSGRVLHGITGAPVSARIEGIWEKARRKVWSDPGSGRFAIARPAGDSAELLVRKRDFLALRSKLGPADTSVLLRIYPIEEEVVVPVENIFFEPNSTELARRAQTGLDQMLEFLLDNPDVQMEIRGHTNNLCSEGYCLELSLKRAKSARRYLLEQGVLAEQLRAAGYGLRQPIASNDTEEGRARNQRVEFVILGRVPLADPQAE